MSIITGVNFDTVHGTPQISIGNVNVTNLSDPQSQNIELPFPKSEKSFQGHDEDMQKLISLFFEEQKQKIVVFGPSGYGTSELCKQFLEYCVNENKTTYNVWVNAESVETVKQSFKKHLEYLKVDTKILATAKKIQKTVCDFLPTEQCLILITANLNYWDEDVSSIELSSLSPDNAVGVLRSVLGERFKPVDKMWYSQLANLVGCVPRKLHKAASYIIYEMDKQGEEFNLQKFIRSYQNSGNPGAGRMTEGLPLNVESRSQVSESQTKRTRTLNKTSSDDANIPCQSDTSRNSNTRIDHRLNNSEQIYTVDYSNGKKNGRVKILDEKHDQFIEGEWQNNRLVKIYNAQIQTSNSVYFRLYGSDNLYTSNENNFVARYELPKLNILWNNFYKISQDIKSRIKIIKILEDDLTSNLEISRKEFESMLKSYQRSVIVSKEVQRDLFYLCCIFTRRGYTNITVLKEIAKDRLISQELRNKAQHICDDEQKFTERNNNIFVPNNLTKKEIFWIQVIFNCINVSSTNLKNVLIKALPSQTFISSGQEDINSLQPRQLFTCNVQDIQLFSDLELTIQQHSQTFQINYGFNQFTEEYINKLWKMLINKIKNSELENIRDKSTYTNPVFLHLFKSFIELLNLVCNENKDEINKIVQIESFANLNFYKKSGKYTKRMEFLISLMNHFKPSDVKCYVFSYSFSFFSVNETILTQLTGKIKNFFDNSLSSIPQESVIWLYYIHTNFKDMFSQDESKLSTANKLKLSVVLNSLINLFKTVTNQEVSLEKLRILSNSIIKFGTTISPYFLDQTSVAADEMSLLLKQAEYIKDFLKANEHALNDITDIVDIYQVFWVERKHLFTDLSRKYFGFSSSDEFISNFDTFVTHVFNLNIYKNKFLIFLRSFNEFIRLLRGTDFPWYVKENDVITFNYVELVDPDKYSYIVKNTQSFLQEFSANSTKDLPSHYLLDLAKHFMDCTKIFLDRNTWNDNDKMQAASDLMFLMARSLINFKKCANALNFQDLLNEFTNPFYKVTSESSDVNDFKKRLGSLETYYKYTLQLNDMNVIDAIELCKKMNISSHSGINYSFDSTHILESCFKIYLDTFKNYILDFSIHENVENLVSAVQREIKSVDINNWNSNFKKTELPKILAGLSAVWSALESRDINYKKQDQVIKPHCIQILCILRLLGVDQTNSGFDSHLAQVLTGQGKSIVLGLLAAILALTENPVHIVCYNEYLATRDREEFYAFYKTFNIENKIKYSTFDDMANKAVELDIEGSSINLRTFVEEIITNDLRKKSVKKGKYVVSKTVLLIDEVDVFFSPEFYGNTYNPCTTIDSETLANLQIKIWNQTSTYKNEDIRNNIQKDIDTKLPQSSDKIFVNIATYSRRILNRHIDEMINNAMDVRKSSPGDWYSKTIKLHKDGYIFTVLDNGKHSTTTYYNYKNIFMYFKLKMKNYEHKNFKNYGYLKVNCGNVSYALLPKNYHVILGVTGTLKQLSTVEVTAVTSYNIKRGSDMPTFFGGNKLHKTNLTIKNTMDAWTKAILDSILSVYKKKRAVIVFFTDEQTIYTFCSKYVNHLPRYWVLTGNEGRGTVANYVEEAGVAQRVTFCIRCMGRGVDFKANDSAVEAKGGIHVIQTFWSEDVKEETQIKGRTARKDNKGSYVAILCREHLTKAGYENTLSSYDNLSEERKRRATEKGTELSQKIQKSQEKHDATMKFLKSLYTYDPYKREEYLNKYPFVDL